MVPAHATTVKDLTKRLAGWLRRLPPEQERMAALVRDLDAHFGSRTDPVTEEACREIERAAWAYSRHLELVFDPAGTDPPDEESKGWDDPDPDEVLRRGAGIRQVRRVVGDVCVLQIDGLEPAHLAQPYVMAFGLRGMLLASSSSARQRWWRARDRGAHRWSVAG